MEKKTSTTFTSEPLLFKGQVLKSTKSIVKYKYFSACTEEDMQPAHVDRHSRTLVLKEKKKKEKRNSDKAARFPLPSQADD